MSASSADCGSTHSLNGEAVTVMLVRDSCSDLPAEIATSFDVNVLHIDAQNVGTARGMDAQRLLDEGAR